MCSSLFVILSILLMFARKHDLVMVSASPDLLHVPSGTNILWATGQHSCSPVTAGQLLGSQLAFTPPLLLSEQRCVPVLSAGCCRRAVVSL